MKFLIALRDISLPILLIYLLFFSLSKTSKSNLTTSRQKEEVITLMPVEAYLRGSIKLDDKNRLVNWRTNKNIAHWKFECTSEGQYKVKLIHGKANQRHSAIINHSTQRLQKEIQISKRETELGILNLEQGIHEIAFHVPDLPQKTKLPTILSIILTKN